MLRLNLTGRTETVDLGDGARLFCDPIDHAVVIECFAETDSSEDPNAATRLLGCRVITGWEGIHDLETGEEIAFDEDLLPRMMREPRVFGAFYRTYVLRATELVAEGNGSSPSPSGDGRAEPDTAKPATASAKPARKKPTARARSKAGRSGG